MLEDFAYDLKFESENGNTYIIAPKIDHEENTRRVKVWEDTSNMLLAKQGLPPIRIFNRKHQNKGA